MNSVNIVGRLTREPYVINGESFKTAYVSLAVNEGKDKVTYVDIVAYNRMADNLQNCHKGDRIGIEGELQNQKVKNEADGKAYNRTIVKTKHIQFLSSKKVLEESEYNPVDMAQPQSQMAHTPSNEMEKFVDDHVFSQQKTR